MSVVSGIAAYSMDFAQSAITEALGGEDLEVGGERASKEKGSTSGSKDGTCVCSLPKKSSKRTSTIGESVTFEPLEIDN
jgi:hypothetical protein